jgi:hypothetical protein
MFSQRIETLRFYAFGLQLVLLDAHVTVCCVSVTSLHSPGDVTKATVECIGRWANSKTNKDEIWCGMGNGHIKVRSLGLQKVGALLLLTMWLVNVHRCSSWTRVSCSPTCRCSPRW